MLFQLIKVLFIELFFFIILIHKLPNGQVTKHLKINYKKLDSERIYEIFVN